MLACAAVAAGGIAGAVADGGPSIGPPEAMGSLLRLAMLGDAEAGECSMGSVTYYQQERKETIIPASQFRVVRFSKTKKEEA